MHGKNITASHISSALCKPAMSVWTIWTWRGSRRSKEWNGQMWQGAGGQRGRKQISTQCLTKLQTIPASFHTNVSLSSMQQSGHHFQPHAQKRQETNFHQNISECQFKSVSSHKCLTNSKLNLSAHTNFSLSSKGRESHFHLASHKCRTKLHAAKRPPLSTFRLKGIGHKFPSTYQNANSKVSAHTNVSRIPSLNLSAHTNVSLSSKGRESHPHLVSHKYLIKLHAAKRPSVSTSRSKGTEHKFPSTYQNANSKASAHTNVSRIPNQTHQLTQMSH